MRANHYCNKLSCPFSSPIPVIFGMLGYHTKEKANAMKNASTDPPPPPRFLPPNTVEVLPAAARKQAQKFRREASFPLSLLLRVRNGYACSPPLQAPRAVGGMSQQDCEKVAEALLPGPSRTASLQVTRLRCIPCPGERVNARTRGVCDKPPLTRPRISLVGF